MVVYYEFGIYCGVRSGRSVESVKRAVLREVGTNVGVDRCCRATVSDVAYVRGFGGAIPPEAERMLKEPTNG